MTRNLFVAKKSTFDYWTVIFVPTGRWLGRYREYEAKRIAQERNISFTRKHQFVGKKIGIYDSGGKLIEKRKVIAVDPNPKGMKQGVISVLLDDGYIISKFSQYFKFEE